MCRQKKRKDKLIYFYEMHKEQVLHRLTNPSTKEFEYLTSPKEKKEFEYLLANVK